jgi:hypothetical protein
MARVAVTHDVWIDFRRAIGGRSIAEALGDLVEREVERYRSAGCVTVSSNPANCSRRLSERASSRLTLRCSSIASSQ